MVFGIVVMGRTYQTDKVLPEVKAEIDKMNHDGSLPAGVKVIPF
jgi:heavy metal efflux system protein